MATVCNKKAASALNELLHDDDDFDEEDLVGAEKVELRSSPRIAKQRSKVSVPQEGRAWLLWH